MALNPPIMTLPQQEADRDAHIQRFLTSLPRLGSSVGPNDRRIEVGDEDRNEVREEDETETKGRIACPSHGDGCAYQLAEEAGPSVPAQHDLETERRRYDRKIRRRQKAAIVNPKPAQQAQAKETDPPEELPDEWWDEFRRRKRGEPTPVEWTTEKPGRIPKSGRQAKAEKGKGKGKARESGLKGMDIVMNYKPAVPIVASRLTLPPRSSKGLFGNGRSSDPLLLASLTSGKAALDDSAATKADEPGRPTTRTQQAPKRIIGQSGSSDIGDWRDRWRANPAPQQDFSHLPPPGVTQSSPWPSQIPTSNPPSRSIRRSTPALQEGWQERYMYRGSAHNDSHHSRSSHPNPDITRSYSQSFARSHPHSSTHSHQHPHPLSLPSRSSVVPAEERTLPASRQTGRPVDVQPIYLAQLPAQPPGPYGNYQNSLYPYEFSATHPHRVYIPHPHMEEGTIPPELEVELQDFWKRDTRQSHSSYPVPSYPSYDRQPYPSEVSRQCDLYRSPHLTNEQETYSHPQPAVDVASETHDSHARRPAIDMYAPNQHSHSAPHDYEISDNRYYPWAQDSYETHRYRSPSSPYLHLDRKAETPHPESLIIPSIPGPSSISGSQAYRPSLQPVAEHEMEEYGTTTGEWKHLWSSRKPFR